MKISVIIAVRNEKKHIKECVNALYQQDYEEPYEVIIVDGESTDGTYEELQELQKKYNFTLLKNKKKNAAAGRNLGIQKATGEYVAFIDADAIPYPDWLTKIQETIKKTDADGVGGPDLLPPETNKISYMIGITMTSPLARGGKLNPSTQHTLLEEEKYVEHIPTCNICYKKETIKKIGLFDEEFIKGQDLELNYRLNKAGYKLYYTPEIKVTHYRKQTIKDFTKQIYKWAKAKIAITKKHGIINHAYLLPIYVIIAAIILLIISILLKNIQTYIILIFTASITYITLITMESIRLAVKNKKINIIPYSLILLPLIHLSYTLGVITASIKKHIW